MRFEVLHEKNNYALIVRGINLDEYAVVYKLDKAKGCWANTCSYYNFSEYSSLSQPEALMYALDMFLVKTEEDYISRCRLEELATKFKDKLMEDDCEEEFFDWECDMETYEKKFFGLIEEEPEYGDDEEEAEWHDTCEAPKTQITCDNCCYFYKDCDEDGSSEDEYSRCHYPYDDNDAPCNW